MLDWRQVYARIASETDPKFLTGLIYEVESLIVKRGEELLFNPNREESREIQAALTDMLTIKEARLGWPNPRNRNGHS